jgi:hypothetical protein
MFKPCDDFIFSYHSLLSYEGIDRCISIVILFYKDTYETSLVSTSHQHLDCHKVSLVKFHNLTQLPTLINSPWNKMPFILIG